MRKDDEKTPASLESLTALLEKAKRENPASLPPKKLPGDAARSAIDFTSATAVGSLLGYGWDRWQDTLPWGLLMGLLIGTAAGLKLMFANEARERARAQKDNDKT